MTNRLHEPILTDNQSIIDDDDEDDDNLCCCCLTSLIGCICYLFWN